MRSKISPVVPQAQGETCFAEKGRRCRTSRSGGSIFTAGNCKCLHRPEQPRLKAQRVHFILSKKADSGDVQTAPQHCRLFAVRDLAFSKTRQMILLQLQSTFPVFFLPCVFAGIVRAVPSDFLLPRLMVPDLLPLPCGPVPSCF